LSGQSLNFQVEVAEIVFMLGANGTGESSLMQRFYFAGRQNGRRTSAHRQTWFESNPIQISGRHKRETERNVLNYHTDPASRWRDAGCIGPLRLAKASIPSCDRYPATHVEFGVERMDGN
jgi:hypothetical protein